jgi:hypothetical protein
VTTRSEPLAATALTFCRLCLGWRQPVDRRYGEQNKDPLGRPSAAWDPYIFDGNAVHPDFHYTDLGVVMEAVKAWCADKTKRAWLNIQLASSTDWTKWQVSLFDAEVIHDDLRYALMAVCVEAARKLQADFLP